MGNMNHSSPRSWAALATAALAALALASCSSSTPVPAGEIDTTPITLPDHAGELLSYDRECDAAHQDEEKRQRCHESAQKNLAVSAEFAERVSDAYGGAASGAGFYATGGFYVQAEMIAVRADTPGLWTSEGGDAWEERSGWVSRERVETRNGVDCVLVTDGTYTLDADVEEIEYLVKTCQKSANGLTVRLDFGASLSTKQFPLDSAFTWTADAYNSIS